MREKIARKLEDTWFEIEHMEDLWLQMADVSIKLICEEIEKGLLTDEEMSKVKFDMGSPWGLVDRYTVGKAIAQAQLEKILTLFRK